MAEIIDLEEKRVDTKKLYKHTQEVIDQSTGEIVQRINSFVKKEKSKDNFIKLFVDNIAYLVENCSANARTVFWVMLRGVNYDNVFIYNSGFIEYFTKNKILGKTSVYTAMKELEEKRVIFRLTSDMLTKFDVAWGTTKNCFLINPQIIGKGTFNELEELRHTSIKTFNFNTLEMKQEFVTETKYEGFNDIAKNSNQYKIDEVKQIKHSENTQETQFVIAEKDKPIETEIVVDDKKSNTKAQDEKDGQKANKELELAILNAENKKLELQLELKKLDMQSKNQSLKETK